MTPLRQPSAASPTSYNMMTLPRFIRRQCIARPLAVISVCFLLGIIWAEGREIPPYLLVCASIGASVIAIAVWRMTRLRAWIGLMLLLPFLFGAARMQYALEAYTPVGEHFSVSFEGVVASEPTYNAESERIVCALRLDSLDGTKVDCTVRLYLRSDVIPLEGIEYGQRLRCFGHVWPQAHATNPYQFDSAQWLLSDGMSGMAAAKLEDVEIEPAGWSINRFIITVRNAISDRIDLLFPRNTELARALILGDRSGLDIELSETFSQTGVTHLICISGMHVSVLAMAVSRILTGFMRRRTAVWITLAAVLAYGFLLGFPASLIRATVMFAVFSLAPSFGGFSDPVTRLCAALLGMLACNPFYIYDGGFVLSFAASAGILLLNEPLECLFGVDRLKAMRLPARKSFRVLKRALIYFPQLLCATLAAQLATIPAVIAYFGAQPLISLPVNLFAIPLAMYAYPLALLALALSYIYPPVGQMLAVLGDGMLTLLVDLISAFASIPINSVHSPRYPGWLLAAHCVLAIAASGVSRLRIGLRRWMPVAMTALIGVAMLCGWINALGFRTVFLDAEQADAAVVSAEGHVYLFDVGDVYTPAADYVAGSFLGVDAVFLSHPHYDHAGGLAELLEVMPPEAIYVPKGWFDVEAAESVQNGIDLAQAMGIPILELAAGDMLQLSENCSVYVHAPTGTEKSVNDLSLLLEVVYFDSSVLFTGDLSIEGEPEGIPDADVLKVPHHGSAKATSERLLQSATPEVSVISVGDNNYGHPSEETLERLSVVGSEVYRTDQCGAITVQIASDGRIYVETYLPLEE